MKLKNMGRARWTALIIAMLINGSLLFFFHNKFWVPADEGQMAHVAERIANGEVLGRDLQDVRPGYHNFVNAAALKLFGKSLVSLRYPLVLMTFIQSGLVFFLFCPLGNLLAALASISSIAFGLLHYLNPNYHWYCLFQVILMVCVMVWVPSGSKWRLPLTGFFLGNAGLFRHLSAVFVAMGVFSYLFIEKNTKIYSQGGVLGKMILAVMLIVLILYLKKATDLTGFILFGIWPVVILGWALFQVKVSDKEVLQVVGGVLSGVIVSVLPILIYLTMHGSLLEWLKDNTIRITSVMDWTYIRLASHDDLVLGGAMNILRWKSFPEIINGFYWVLVPYIAFLNGAFTFYHAFKREERKSLDLAFPFIAVFYAIVSVFNQIPIYIFLTLGFTLPGLLWNVSRYRAKWVYPFTLGITMILCVVSVYYHAGQSLIRGDEGTLKGERVGWTPSAGQMPRNGLWIDARDIKVFSEVVKYIQTQTRPDETIFVIPNSAELYFLSDRRNPFRFYSTDHAVQNEKDLEQTIEKLRKEPPRLVIYLTHHKRSTPLSERIMDYVRENYVLSNEIAVFQFYRHP